MLQSIPRGRDNAVSMKALADTLAVSTRDVQHLVKHLIEEHGKLIASATGRNHGYYYPDSAEEYQAAVDQLRHRIISLAARIRVLDRRAFEEIFGQGNMFIERAGAV